MRPSRGLGAIAPSKRPKEVVRRDGPEPTKLYAAGGEAKAGNPALWSKVKAEAKSKFDVYPSAYANAWAAKEYKKRGGAWSGSDNRVKKRD
jgi:hypothetical protein